MDKSATDTRSVDLKLLERHPLKVVVAAFALFFVGTWALFVYAYVPSQLKHLRDQLSECDRAKSEAEAKIPVPPEDPDALTITPVEVGEQYTARHGRDAEQDFFSKSLDAKNIHWEVEITSTDDDGYVFITSPNRRGTTKPVTMVRFTGDMIKRAASLKQGDIIHLDGTLSYSSKDNVVVRDATFSFVRGASTTPIRSE